MDLLRLATAGSVDDGKSTLIGRLLYDSKSLLADQVADAELDLARLTDGLRAEREQGITIDVAYRYFSTGNRSFILADCPGHVQYTRNMVTGATTADAVIVLIDGRKGVLEQTRRHLAVIALLRVPHVIVAVNKIDLLGYAEDAFARVAAQVGAVTAELGIEDVHDGRFGTATAQRGAALVLAADHRTNRVALRQKEIDDRPTGLSGRAGHENGRVGHGVVPFGWHGRSSVSRSAVQFLDSGRTPNRVC